MNKRLNTAFEEFQATMAAQFIIGGSMGSGIFIMQSEELFFCTARHVVFNTKKTNNATSFSLKNKTARIRSYPKATPLQLINDLELDLNVLSSSKAISMNTKYDLCILHIGTITKRKSLALTKGVKKISKKINLSIADSEMIKPANKVQVGEECFVVGYPKALAKFNPSTPMYNYELPLVRKGIISCMNDYNTFVIDCAVYGGNSGGPVFVAETSIDIDEKKNLKFNSKTHLVGIVSKYVPLVNSTGVIASGITRQQQSIPHLENSGYGICISFELIKKTITTNISKRKRAKTNAPNT